MSITYKNTSENYMQIKSNYWFGLVFTPIVLKIIPILKISTRRYLSSPLSVNSADLGTTPPWRFI